VTLREARQEAGLTQVELAKKSGVSQSTISEIETRGPGGRIDLDVLERLCYALGVEPGDILVRKAAGRRRK
jgi:transcriptional regulator with XRE-family HTH domain